MCAPEQHTRLLVPADRWSASGEMGLAVDPQYNRLSGISASECHPVAGKALTTPVARGDGRDSRRRCRVGMSIVRVESVVHARPAEVFDHVATHHFQNHPRWDPDVVEMRQTSPGPVGVGTTASVVRRQGKRRVEGVATVTAYEPDRAASWRVEFRQFQLHQDVALVPEEAGAATRLSLSIETSARGPLRLLLPFMRPRFRTTMERSVAAIAALVEPSTQ